MEVLIKILPQEFIKNHFSTSIFSLDMLLKSSKSCFYNRGPNSQTLVGFGNFPKFKNLSQILFQNPRNWENSQSLTTLQLFEKYKQTTAVFRFRSRPLYPVLPVAFATFATSGKCRNDQMTRNWFKSQTFDRSSHQHQVKQNKRKVHNKTED